MVRFHTKFCLTFAITICIVQLLIAYYSDCTLCDLIRKSKRRFGFMGNRIGNHTKAGERAPSFTKHKRKKRIAIFAPGLDGIKHWREYGDLVTRYAAAAELKTRLPDSNLTFVDLQCPVQNCSIEVITTNDTEWLRTCDAIIVNVLMMNRDFSKQQQHAIKVIGNKTKWFLFAVESGDRYQLWNKDFKNTMFHYSITYHSESTVQYPYGRYIPNEPTDVKPRNWAAGKTRLVAWMASNCSPFAWPRKEWVEKLKSLISVDMYGWCGTLSCGKFDPIKPASKNLQCMDTLQRYKFYLALESAECDEYITEKFWGNSLLAGAVPVVYGGRKEAYTRLAPPHSFIHISDFQSMNKLADYLKYLDANDDKYNEYFAWRYRGRVAAFYPPLNISDFMCRMIPVLERNDSVPFKKVEETDLYHGCSHTPFLGNIFYLSRWKPRV